MRRLLVTLAVVVGLAGCGAEAEPQPPAGQPQAAEPTRAASASTPRQAVLGWWRYVRAKDPQSARAFYADPPALPDLAGQFNFLGERLGGEIEVLSSAGKRGITRVRALWSPPSGKPRKVTLRLREEGGTWKLLDARFLDEMVARLQREA